MPCHILGSTGNLFSLNMGCNHTADLNDTANLVVITCVSAVFLLNNVLGGLKAREENNHVLYSNTKSTRNSCGTINK